MTLTPIEDEKELRYDPDLKNELVSLKGRDGKYVISTLSDVPALIDWVLQDREKAVKEARIKAQLGMVEYYDQCSDNKDMDWKGLFADNRKVLEYELAELEQEETNDGTQ